jgi:hypothetical protein
MMQGAAGARYAKPRKNKNDDGRSGSEVHQTEEKQK